MKRLHHTLNSDYIHQFSVRYQEERATGNRDIHIILHYNNTIILRPALLHTQRKDYTHYSLDLYNNIHI